MAAEIVRSVRLSRDEFLKHVTVRNPELPRDLLAQGRPVLLVAAHQANWEWVAAGHGGGAGLSIGCGLQACPQSFG